MALLSKEELRTLMRERADQCVSIFMPTHVARPTQEDSIRFKNLIRQAENHLLAQGIRSPEAQQMLRPAQNLLTSNEFWEYQGHGLAAFISPNVFRTLRVPLELDELVVINNRFYVKPLLPLATNDGKFYILALSQDSIRLFSATRHEIEEVKLSGVPKSIEEALPYDVGGKVGTVHAGSPGPGEKKKLGVFTGQGDLKDVYKNNILRFFKKVDAGVYKVMARETAPLVLAGVEYLHPLYREASSYANLLDEGITGNSDEKSPIELHALALPIVEPILSRRQAEMAHKYRQFAGEQNGLASADLKEILPAACNGRVDTLFVAVGTQEWGKFDPATEKVEMHSSPQPGDEDLLDLASIHTYLNDGTVYAVKPDQVPSGESAAAVFRYALRPAS
jgi:hypothetical protein